MEQSVVHHYRSPEMASLETPAGQQSLLCRIKLPPIFDDDATVIHITTPGAFQIAPLTAPGKSVAEVNAMLDPFTKKSTELCITYTRNVTSESTFLSHYTNDFSPLPYGAYSTAQLLGGRLVPRPVVEKNNDALTAMIHDITENSAFLHRGDRPQRQPQPQSNKSVRNQRGSPSLARRTPDRARTIAMEFYASNFCRGIARDVAYGFAYPKAYSCDAAFGDICDRGGSAPGNMEGGFFR